MKLSLKKRIENFLRGCGIWISGLNIEKLALNAGYKSSNASRRCRELVNEGILERRETIYGYVEYKIK